VNPSATLSFVSTALKTYRCLTLGIVLTLLGSACEAPTEDQATQNYPKISETAEAANTSVIDDSQETVVTSVATTVSKTTASSNNNWEEKLLNGLIVSSSPAPVKYDRDDWGSGWSDADRNCMNARHEVLKAESVDSTQLSSNRCTVTGGRWYAAFTGTWITNPSTLDIDHFVPLANAHASGGWAWSSTTKRNYYNDLSDPKHLIAVTASANRSKGSRGPESWKPTDTSYWCAYAHTWATIKTRWELTVTASELGALTVMLNKCDAEPSSKWTPPAAPATTSSTSTSSTSATVAQTNTTTPANPGNTKNCSDFSSYPEAKAWFNTYFPYYADVAKLDGDSDGEPCESLPGGP
jgi:hypothetical protein